MLTGVKTIDNRIHDPRRSVHDVQRRMKTMLASLCALSIPDLRPSPTRIHAVHVNSIGMIIRRRSARHHVQRRLGHVRMRMPGRFEFAIKLPFHRRDIHDVFVPFRCAQHQGLQPRIQNKRRHALTSCTSNNSTDETSASVKRHEFRSRKSICCKFWSSLPSGNKSFCASKFLRQQWHL